MISIADVSHSYGDRQVLCGITAEIEQQRIGVIGANGSGKSTLARMLNGLIIPERGRVVVNGFDTRRHVGEIRRRVGFIFADPATQIIMPTVAEDVAIGLRRRRLPRDETERRVADALQRFELAEYRDHPAHLLSSGQQQLLALASVMVTEPDIVVCDEPTTLLDLRNITKVLSVLESLPQQVVLCTHHLDTLERFDRVLVMDAGRIVFDGLPDESIEYYRKLMTA